MSRSHSLSLAALSPCPPVSGAVNPARPSHQAQSTMTAVLRDSGIRTGSRRPRLVRGMVVAAGCAPRAFGADFGARAAPAQRHGAGAKQPRPSPSPQGALEKGTARLGWHSPKPAAAQTWQPRVGTSQGKPRTAPAGHGAGAPSSRCIKAANEVMRMLKLVSFRNAVCQ